MIKHPPYSSLLCTKHPNMIYTDIYMDYPIGDIVKYWTKILIDYGIRLDKIKVDENGFGDAFYRPHYKTFPWSVNILHMYSETFTSMNREDCYKINFNLENKDITDLNLSEIFPSISKGVIKGISHTYIGQIGYKMKKEEKQFITNLFQGKWVDYLDIQGSRIIVQFWLNDYMPIFRKEKILKIQKKALSL